MSCVASMLASSNPIDHIMDVPWRVGGREIHWMSSHIAVMVLATALLAVSMPLLLLRGRRRTDCVGLGLIEVLVTFIRVQIAQVALGKAADKAVPYLATLFMFLLTMNVLGLVPLMQVSTLLGLDGWGGTDPLGRPLNVTPIGGTPTSGLWVAASFAALTFLMVLLSGYIRQVHLLWEGGAEPSLLAEGDDEHGGGGHKPLDAGMNIWLDWAQHIQRRRWPLPIAMVGGVWTWLNSFVPPLPGVVGLCMWPVLLFLELIGYVTKCAALCIRLVANMSSGHILLAVLIGFAQGARGWMNLAVGVPVGLGVVALMMLELMVALLQAYLFTFLSALFIGLAVNPHH